MSLFSEIAWQPLGVLLRFAAMLLFIGQLFVLLLNVRRRGGWMLLLTILHAAFGLCLLTLLYDAAYRLDYLAYARDYLPPVRWVLRLPWPWIAAAEALSALLLVFCLLRHLRFVKTHPGMQSVKQAVDLLPAGICIAAEDGTIRLSNLKMNALNRALTGSAWPPFGQLREAVQRQGEPQGDRLLLRLDDGTRFLLWQRELLLDGQRYIQLNAEDVTEQYRATEALERENARLRDLQQRLKAYRKGEAELVMRQELLAARTTVHNQLGGALLTGKYHLEHPEQTDPEALRLLLSQINTYLLSEAEDPEMAADEYDSALHLAESIGVRVALTGEVPQTGVLRSLLGQAISECAVNAVKHAGGDLLQVSVAPDRFRIESNGRPAPDELVPTGGLRSLKLAAEQAGGTMTLESHPCFCLTVCLPA